MAIVTHCWVQSLCSDLTVWFIFNAVVLWKPHWQALRHILLYIFHRCHPFHVLIYSPLSGLNNLVIWIKNSCETAVKETPRCNTTFSNKIFHILYQKSSSCRFVSFHSFFIAVCERRKGCWATPVNWLRFNIIYKWTFCSHFVYSLQLSVDVP